MTLSKVRSPKSTPPLSLRLDSHVDTLHEFARLGIEDYDLSHEHAALEVDLPKLARSGTNALFFALFVKQEWGVQGGRDRIERLLEIMERILAATPRMVPACSPTQIVEALAANKVAVALGIENGVILGDDLSMVERYFDQGIGYLTLCHNSANQICDSSTDSPVHGGLSPFGARVVTEMNRLGMMIDLSHASDQAAEQVLGLSELPVIASHSNARAVCDNPRNLSDDLIELIAANGGVVQVSVLPKCVGGAQDVSAVVDHIDHIVGLVGIDHVGIGSDFDGGGGVKGCRDASDLGAVTSQLRARGYDAQSVDKIWGQNFMRVYSANWHS